MILKFHSLWNLALPQYVLALHTSVLHGHQYVHYLWQTIFQLSGWTVICFLPCECRIKSCFVIVAYREVLSDLTVPISAERGDNGLPCWVSNKEQTFMLGRGKMRTYSSGLVVKLVCGFLMNVYLQIIITWCNEHITKKLKSWLSCSLCHDDKSPIKLICYPRAEKLTGLDWGRASPKQNILRETMQLLL